MISTRIMQRHETGHCRRWHLCRCGDVLGVLDMHCDVSTSNFPIVSKIILTMQCPNPVDVRLWIPSFDNNFGSPGNGNHSTVCANSFPGLAPSKTWPNSTIMAYIFLDCVARCWALQTKLSIQRPGSLKNTTQHHDASFQSTLDRRSMYYSQKMDPSSPNANSIMWTHTSLEINIKFKIK